LEYNETAADIAANRFACHELFITMLDVDLVVYTLSFNAINGKINIKKKSKS
jgi:hypothetical protein